jgi:hypothetical protein
LAGTGLDVLGVLLQQTFVDVGLDINVQPDPHFPIDEVDETTQFGRLLNLILRFAKDSGDEARTLPQGGQDVAILGLQLVTLSAQQALPVEVGGDDARLAQQPAVLVIHFEEEQVGELLDIVTVGDTVIAQDVAVIPKALNDGGRLITQRSIP